MPLYFDAALPQITADRIKPMARIWGGTSSMRKDQCIECISKGLANPAQVKAVVDGLEPWQRNALALIKRMGGRIDSQNLVVGIRMSGIHPPLKYEYRDSVIDPLFRKGLILSMDFYNPSSLSYSSYADTVLYSDERLLAQVGFPEIQPFNLSPIPEPESTQVRRPSIVTLDIVGMLQTIEKIGGLRLTQSGDVRINDEKKVRKAMGWDEEGVEIDGFFFPDPITAWVDAFRYSDLLQLQDNNHLFLKESPESFALRPFSEQVRLLMEGLIRSNSWREMPIDRDYGYYDRGRRQGRLALTLALSALPIDSDAFFSIDDFDQAVFDRIGEHFTLGVPPNPPYFLHSQTSQERKQIIADWRVKLRTQWLKQERPWLGSAFTTWLYFLGLVELAVKHGRVSGFRLTGPGMGTFHPELLTLAPQAETITVSANQPAWVVQPNFDIIAYLDRTSAPQLAFLERHAERTQTNPHTVQYRLTRESVYRGLESGTVLTDLMDGLKAGAQTELPQNVLVELREWAALRERIVLHHSVCLLEFTSAEARQSAAKSMSGREVGDRFLLFEQKPENLVWPAGFKFDQINYAQSLPKDLSVTELGRIHLKHAPQDLITADQLNQWAVNVSASEWQLTAESVSTRLKIGRKITELLGLLTGRSVYSLPPLLEIALRSWAGENYQVELDSVVVLHCPQEQLFSAISKSPTIKPFLKGYLPPDLLFVDVNHLKSLRVQLNWLGCFVSDQLRILPLNETRGRMR